MLVSIGVTPSATTTARRHLRQGTEAGGRSHKKGHRCQQLRDAANDNFDYKATKPRRQQQRQYANNNNDNATLTATMWQ